MCAPGSNNEITQYNLQYYHLAVNPTDILSAKYTSVYKTAVNNRDNIINTAFYFVQKRKSTVNGNYQAGLTMKCVTLLEIVYCITWRTYCAYDNINEYKRLTRKYTHELISYYLNANCSNKTNI